MSLDRRLMIIAATAAIGAMTAPVFAAGGLARADFAGGCFWTIERDFEHTPGVVRAVSGFEGGTAPKPTYADHSGYLETVQVFYDPKKITYRQLVDHYWRFIDPTDDRGQACDRGPTYRSAIFVATPQERADAEASKASVDQGKLKGKIAVRILPQSPFFAAGPEHQGYARKNSIAYNAYRVGCGRDTLLKQIWGSAPA